ncbi:heterokaryon incompatibility protein-domain-containing protein [Pyrenochaeta sp. MPI-SDFR-AT-0127]|nr:heterokaryon incompatibility protein-domain-containing protein [Pyrenochaeta sp. MPI-SDFR-AT-0127]
MALHQYGLHNIDQDEGPTTITSYSNRSTPLHELCQECRAFCGSWDVLNWIQIHHDAEAESFPAIPAFTVAQLTENQNSCHLCMFVLASLERRIKKDSTKLGNTPVYLSPRVVEKGVVNIAARLEEEMLEEDDRRRDNEDIIHFPSFVLKSYIASGGFQEHITTKEVPCFARDNIPRAKGWIKACCEEHKRCQDFHNNSVFDCHQRPTRIIEITETKIRLRCDIRSERYDYLVLSHMWGPNPTHQLQLLHEHLEKFQEEIPWVKFEASSTFREAVQTTRTLGYRYLWIDSLCIIQDSPTDWQYEADRMAIVYGNAICSLAFLFPADREGEGEGEGEPIPCEDPRIWSPCILRPASSSHHGVYIVHITSTWRRQFDHDEKYKPWLVQRDWPLFGRAWAFQEYLLSPRTLLIGHQNLMWQCSELFYDEILGPIAHRHESTSENPKRGKDLGKSRYFPESISAVATATTLSAPSLLSFMKDWHSLVEEYRARKLTYAKDRVIAFSGIARAFQTLGKMTYLAGAWNEVLPLSLLWYVDKKLSSLVRKENAIPNGAMPASIWTADVGEHTMQAAPSWSWFSVPIYKVYQLWFLLDDDEVYVRSKSYLATPLVCWDDIFWAKPVAYQFASESPNRFPEATGFFDFTGLQVTLEMPILPVKAGLPKDLAEQMDSLREASDSPDDEAFCWLPDFEYFPDIPAGRISPPRNAVYALVAEFQTVRVAGKHNIQRRLAGLMLVPGLQTGTWVRVGAWKLKLKISNVPVNAENMASVARRWRSYAVVSAKWSIETVTLC